jgi:IS30 family transposase
MSQGMSSKAACRAVGINSRTGKRWRNGRTVMTATGRVLIYQPIVHQPSAISSRFLSEDERIAIADGLVLGQSLRAIAAELGHPASTVSREVRRNCDAGTGAYNPCRAQRLACARRARPRPGKLELNSELRSFVQGHLEKRWSPEQISKVLAKQFPDRPEMRVAHETIYQALYVQGRGQLRRELQRALRTGRARRRPHRRGDQRHSRFASPMLMISDRPPEVMDRAVPGHWEGDLLMGQLNRSAIGTLVERSTRYVMLLHLPDGHGPERVRDALVETVSTLPSHLARSLTWDQGTEMHRHAEFTVATNVPVYFCDPASPWQRGSNENTNGLLRQYFPKGTDLSAYSADELVTVAAELNSRPRKTLDWETPADRLDKLLQTAT